MIRSLLGTALGTALAALATALALTCITAGQARADSIERGYIVRIEDREIYFNIEAQTKLERGDALRIKRPIRLKHPVTGKQIADWLPLGSAKVWMVGESMAVAVLDPSLLAQVQVGDVVELLVLTEEAPPPPPEPAPAPEPAPEPAEPETPLPEVDAATRDVLAMWQATSGREVEVRIGAWEQFLTAHPDSPYAAAIQEDLEILRVHRDKLRPPELELDESFQGGLEHSPPSRGRPDEPIELAFLIDTPYLAAAWLHYRVAGAASYSKGVLRYDGPNYLRGQIPAGSVQGPGVEYFVEIATSDGRVGTAVGAPDNPVRVDVPLPPISKAFTEQRNRSRVSVTTSYLDFAMFDDRTGDHTDAFFSFEADFLYRLRGAIYGIRTGMGVINGRGGFSELTYNDTLPAPRAGFNYGYVELELRGKEKLGFRGRGIAGVGRDGFGLGVEGSVRLGEEDGTNLSLGASTLEDIGFLTELRMQWDALNHLPLGLAVALTDRPTQGDLGVRLTADIGYRALSWVQPTLRVSYQARTVVHAGLGAGIGLVFDW